VPHITVRYPIDKLQEYDFSNYKNAIISKIDIIEPGAFGLEESDGKTNITVFVKCRSDDLETFSYKPNFPQSVFHITLYEGNSFSFAKSILNILGKFPWGFTVPLPMNTKLSEIEIGRNSKKTLSILTKIILID
jgi:hypothetical protein